ncbi:hypothetical protein DFQ26_001675, partial [Actinomortierella ambigua]
AEPEPDQADVMAPSRLYVADRFVASSEVEPVQAETYSGDRSLAPSERSYNNINVQRGGRELPHPNLPADHFFNDYFIRRESLDRQLKLQFMELVQRRNAREEEAKKALLRQSTLLFQPQFSSVPVSRSVSVSGVGRGSADFSRVCMLGKE